MGLVLLLSTSGCAALASANAHHNSRGTACIESPGFAIVDLVLGALALGGVATSDTSKAAYAIPGVFLTSGVIGAVSSQRCRSKHEHPAADTTPPLSNTQPSWNAEVDPTAVPATPDDLGVAPEAPVPVEPIAPHGDPLPTLRIDPDKLPGPKPAARISCRDAPSSCPSGQVCAIAGDDAGYCVTDRSH